MSATLVLAAAIGLSGCVEQPQASAGTDSVADTVDTLVPKKPFPDKARVVLRERMKDHGENMERLLWAVLMLDYEQIRVVAAAIGNAPRISRPTPGPLEPLSASMPDDFFPMQKEMFESVSELYDAAKLKDDVAIAREYSRLSGVCIDCHSQYLRPDPIACDRADRDQSYKHRPNGK